MSDKIAIFVSVKQQVNDINSTLAGLLSELKELRGTIDSLYAENRSLNRNIDKLLKENRELRKRLEKYEQPPKDSGNSSTPPSKEPIKAEVDRRTKSLRKKSERPVGGQSGHEGTTRKMVETPDEIQEVSSHYCMECGRDCLKLKGCSNMSPSRWICLRYGQSIVNADFIKKSVAADVAIVIMHRVAGAVMLLSSAKTYVPLQPI